MTDSGTRCGAIIGRAVGRCMMPTGHQGPHNSRWREAMRIDGSGDDWLFEVEGSSARASVHWERDLRGFVLTFHSASHRQIRAAFFTQLIEAMRYVEAEWDTMNEIL